MFSCLKSDFNDSTKLGYCILKKESVTKENETIAKNSAFIEQKKSR